MQEVPPSLHIANKQIIGRRWSQTFSRIQQLNRDYNRDEEFVAISLELVTSIVRELEVEEILFEEAVQVGMEALLEALSDHTKEDVQQNCSAFMRRRVGRALEEFLQGYSNKGRRHLKNMHIVDNDTGNPINVAQQGQFKQRMQLVLDSLTFREREVTKLRYGIDDGFEYSTEEIGKIFKVGRDSVQRIERKALRKLQFPARSNLLKGFLEIPD